MSLQIIIKINVNNIVLQNSIHIKLLLLSSNTMVCLIKFSKFNHFLLGNYVLNCVEDLRRQVKIMI